jgi:hypothetical protein
MAESIIERLEDKIKKMERAKQSWYKTAQKHKSRIAELEAALNDILIALPFPFNKEADGFICPTCREVTSLPAQHPTGGNHAEWCAIGKGWKATKTP